MLEFGSSRQLLASASARMIRIWDCISWQQKWELPIPKEVLALTFADKDSILLAALKNNQLIIWNLLNGTIIVLNWIERLDEQY